MQLHRAIRFFALVALPASLDAQATAASPRPVPSPRLAVPVEYYKLANGLRVVLSRDTTAPTVGVGVYYRVGFRREPRNRTGFAHLFEHLMFQGSKNLGKLQFVKLIENNGGILNGSTRFDFTNYYEVVPAHTLETMLWAEADRMTGLAIDKSNVDNQRDVVKNEVRVNVKNQPYGSFPWIDMPMTANENWANAHDFYGDFRDLDSATMDNAAAFFKQYYAPNNAALAVVGDFDPAQARAWIRKYFSPVPSAPPPPAVDVTEPRQTGERHGTRVDSLANRPAVAVGYHMPARWTPEWFAMGLIDQILAQGRDSWLFEKLVQQKSLTGGVNGGINDLGNQFNYDGPMLWTVSAFHDSDKPAATLVDAIEEEIERLAAKRVDAATLARAKVKMRSVLYGTLDDQFGLGKLDLLASFALFDDDPARINRLEGGFAAVTPALLQKTAQEYLRRDNRTIYTVAPGAKSAPGTR
ncbi:MAG TPA: pitrilysin family protein [Gemmatimonadaceae bacterium]|nr:pitrilysin family protein [Gemmatimonadaceae bacterium]